MFREGETRRNSLTFSPLTQGSGGLSEEQGDVRSRGRVDGGPETLTLSSKSASPREIQYQPQTQATYIILNFLVATLKIHNKKLILIKYFI